MRVRVRVRIRIRVRVRVRFRIRIRGYSSSARTTMEAKAPKRATRGRRDATLAARAEAVVRLVAATTPRESRTVRPRRSASGSGGWASPRRA